MGKRLNRRNTHAESRVTGIKTNTRYSQKEGRYEHWHFDHRNGAERRSS